MKRGLPLTIYRAAQVRELDRLAIEEHGIPGYTLMCRAGEAAFQVLRQRWPWARNLLVLCGAGNNAGDGYVLARMAKAERMNVIVAALVDPDKLAGDARIAWETFSAAGGQVQEWSPELLEFADVVVDAILGTGIKRPLTGRSGALVDAVNDSGRPVFALDIPTGLHADTGHPMGAAVRAAVTMTFGALKLGLFIGEARNYVGDIAFSDLSIPPRLLKALPCAGRRIDSELLGTVLPRRLRTSHKGDFGHVLLIGGGAGMAGAARLAGEAALRAGAGLVTVATLPGHAATIVSGRPELMCCGVEAPADLEPALERASVVAVGPGLGTGAWAEAMLEAALASERPLVVDADALNLLARRDDAPRRDDWVLTPHPGEAGRLLGSDAATVQANRCEAVGRLLERYGGVMVLKGAATVVARVGEVPAICDRGNPGMAAPGMGDVLTGIIAAVAAQRGDLLDAARAGVLIHAAAADDAAKSGERGLLASDLLAHMARWVNPE